MINGGLKRPVTHITTDTQGHVVAAVVHPADIQDRDGAPLVAIRIRSLFPWLRHLIGDGGYAGEKLRNALAELGRCRRLTKDVEATLSSSCAWLMIAHIRRVLRKINQTAF